jgi:predicted RNA binding protein YcfA (HicA-like mRNA interferase family)
MTPRFRRMTATEVEAILRRYGFSFVSQRRSHRKWRNPDSGLQVIVPVHRGRQLPIGTLRNILTNAEIPEEEWKA